LNRIILSLGERTHPIYIGSRSSEKLGALLGDHGLKGLGVVVTQKPVWAAWGKRISAAFEKSGTPFRVYFPASERPSEKSKSAAELLRLVAFLAREDGKGRGVFLAAFGGGVVGDLGGFAASIYRRGIPYVQIPTTLTAQVDSSVGGKTAVDLPEGKNLLGTIYQPRFILMDPDFLQSLPPPLFRDGLAEVVKYAVIRDAELFRYLEKYRVQILERSLPHLEKIITTSVRIKASVVARDELDKKGVRIVLNFGHTLGHAIEAAERYGRTTHGQAVSIGMMLALEISEALGVLKEPALVRRTEQLLEDFGLPTRVRRAVRLEAVLRAVGYDKKNTNGRNRFVLVERLNETVIREGVSADVIRRELVKRRA